MNHTPGPWMVKTNNAYQTSWVIVDAKMNLLAQVANWQNVERNVDGEANAKLMASAPDLALELDRLRESLRRVHEALIHISECASIPERDAEELAEYVFSVLNGVTNYKAERA